jgi:hypothetical protein
MVLNASHEKAQLDGTEIRVKEIGEWEILQLGLNPPSWNRIIEGKS